MSNLRRCVRSFLTIGSAVPQRRQKQRLVRPPRRCTVSGNRQCPYSTQPGREVSLPRPRCPLQRLSLQSSTAARIVSVSLLVVFMSLRTARCRRRASPGCVPRTSCRISSLTLARRQSVLRSIFRLRTMDASSSSCSAATPRTVCWYFEAPFGCKPPTRLRRSVRPKHRSPSVSTWEHPSADHLGLAATTAANLRNHPVIVPRCPCPSASRNTYIGITARDHSPHKHLRPQS